MRNLHRENAREWKCKQGGLSDNDNKIPRKNPLKQPVRPQRSPRGLRAPDAAQRRKIGTPLARITTVSPVQDVVWRVSLFSTAVNARTLPVGRPILPLRRRNEKGRRLLRVVQQLLLGRLHVHQLGDQHSLCFEDLRNQTETIMTANSTTMTPFRYLDRQGIPPRTRKRKPSFLRMKILIAAKPLIYLLIRENLRIYERKRSGRSGKVFHGN